MDDQQRARELWSDALRKVGQHEFAYHVGCGGDLDLSEQATLDAITDALRAAPEGFVLVPVVPTPEMDAHGRHALSKNGVDDVEDSDALVCWAAMLAARPQGVKDA